jgi:hypothetical protein
MMSKLLRFGNKSIIANSAVIVSVESPRSNIKTALAVEIRLERVAEITVFGEDATMRRRMSKGFVKRIDSRLRKLPTKCSAASSILSSRTSFSSSNGSRVIF